MAAIVELWWAVREEAWPLLKLTHDYCEDQQSFTNGVGRRRSCGDGCMASPGVVEAKSTTMLVGDARGCRRAGEDARRC